MNNETKITAPIVERRNINRDEIFCLEQALVEQIPTSPPLANVKTTFFLKRWKGCKYNCWSSPNLRQKSIIVYVGIPWLIGAAWHLPWPGHSLGSEWDTELKLIVSIFNIWPLHAYNWIHPSYTFAEWDTLMPVSKGGNKKRVIKCLAGIAGKKGHTGKMLRKLLSFH